MAEEAGIAVAMAIYKPNMEWLSVQLESLNDQTLLPNRLLVWNDCPEDNTDYNSFFSEHITKFPFEIIGGRENIGSTLAFGELTSMVGEKYLAYCDQDDQWLPEKLSVMLDEAISSGADLVCSDMRVMDGNGRIVAERITDVRPRQVFPVGLQGDELFRHLLYRNFVTGCATLARTSFLKEALPFPKSFVHDWWIGLWTAAYGKLSIVGESLINYRIHGNNQTGILSGINDKGSYYDKRLGDMEERATAAKARFSGTLCEQYIKDFEDNVKLRRAYGEKPTLSGFVHMLADIPVNPPVMLFELLLPFMPDAMFNKALDLARRGVL